MFLSQTFQIIDLVKLARDLTRPIFPNPDGGLVREMGPLISEKSRLVKYYFFLAR